MALICVCSIVKAAGNELPTEAPYDANSAVDDDAQADEDMNEAYHDPDSISHFHLLDTDKSGALSAKELTMEYLMLVHWDETAEEALTAMDYNKDGKIEVEEFIAFGSPRVEYNHANADFTSADADANGFLNKKEYFNTAHAQMMRPQKMKGKQWRKQQFNSLDTNKDKKISREEYLAYNAKDPFTHMDKNEDGKVSPDEWHAYFLEVEPGVHTKDHDFETFKEHDHDKDGFLNRTEHKHQPDESWLEGEEHPHWIHDVHKNDKRTEL